MNRFTLIALAILAPSIAAAQSGANSDSAAVSQTAVTGNGVVTIENQAAPAYVASRADFHTNQAQQPATVFVNPPSADTCARPGFGLSAQAVAGGVGISAPGVESAKCDMRADTINLKVTGAPPEVIKARHCMDAQMEEAYARAGIPCRDMRPPTNAGGVVLSSDPLIRQRQMRSVGG